MNEETTQELEIATEEKITLSNGRAMTLRKSNQINGINEFLYNQIGIVTTRLEETKIRVKKDGVLSYDNNVVKVKFFRLIGFGKTIELATKMAEKAT